MKFENFLNEKEDIQEKIIKFFHDNPTPKDSQIHSFAENEGMDTHKFEEVVYSLIGSFFGAGRSKDFKGEYDPEQLKMGIKVEMEHTTNPLIAKKISQDHLAEFDTYYTGLAEMEKKLEGI